jgi:methylated-DNA-[protein]-cysteine S-methyltransferase
VTLTGWRVETPIGPLSVVCDGDVVVCSGFGDIAKLLERVDGEIAWGAATGLVAGAVERYLAGDGEALRPVQVRQRGGPFQQSAWEAMRGIPAGETWSYSELATKAGRPEAVRAAATACARNLVAPFVPCHRVVRSDGTLGGYAYGLDAKRWLLQLEADSSGSSRTG